jgi:predicted lactoylglutathione lyase
METISPNIIVKDIHQTISFYKLLGFELIATVPEQGDYTWAMMKSGNVVFMFQTFESLAGELPAISRQDGGSLLFYIGIKNIL